MLRCDTLGTLPIVHFWGTGVGSDDPANAAAPLHASASGRRTRARRRAHLVAKRCRCRCQQPEQCCCAVCRRFAPVRAPRRCQALCPFVLLVFPCFRWLSKQRTGCVYDVRIRRARVAAPDHQSIHPDPFLAFLYFAKILIRSCLAATICCSLGNSGFLS